METNVRMGRFLACLLAGACLLGGTARAARTPDYVRLHVVANSDSEADQALKRLVRDGVRAMSAALVDGCGGADEAWETLQKSRALLEGTARLFARAGGFDGPVRVETGWFDFPERTYGQETVPEGRYRAVRVVLGEGAGRNWWCVLYPSLCLGEEEEPALYSAIGRWVGGFFREVGAWLAGR